MPEPFDATVWRDHEAREAEQAAFWESFERLHALYVAGFVRDCAALPDASELLAPSCYLCGGSASGTDYRGSPRIDTLCQHCLDERQALVRLHPLTDEQETALIFGAPRPSDGR